MFTSCVMEKIFNFSHCKTQHINHQTSMHNSCQIIVYIFDIGFFIKAYTTGFKMICFVFFQSSLVVVCLLSLLEHFYSEVTCTFIFFVKFGLWKWVHAMYLKSVTLVLTVW